MVITLKDGTVITDDIAVADAHPLGARPFAREQYVNKFRTLAAGLVADEEIERFLAAAARLPELAAGELDQLNIQAADGVIDLSRRTEGTLLMLYSKITPEQKRIRFRELLASGTIAQFPGAFNPLSARLIEEKGFAGVYISGAVLANDLGLPDIGLTTLTEVATRAGQIARMTDLPSIVDADTGFGEPMNVARSGPGTRERRPGRLPHRGPVQPQALRPPRRQERGGPRDRHQADPRRGRRPARPELPDHGTDRHPRHGRSRGRPGPGQRRWWRPVRTRSSRRR